MPVVLPKTNAVHPDLYDRMLAAGIEPEYLRPEPPSQKRFVGSVILALVPFFLLVFALLAVVHSDKPEWDLPPQLVLAIYPGEAWALGNIGLYKSDWNEAAAFYRAAAELDPSCWQYRANLAVAYLNLQRCDEARIALNEVKQRYLISRNPWAGLLVDLPKPRVADQKLEAAMKRDPWLLSIMASVENCEANARENKRPILPRIGGVMAAN